MNKNENYEEAYEKNIIYLEDARKVTFKNAKKKGGTICPCCDRHIQLYKRSLNADMARSLILIYIETKKKEYRYKKILPINIRDIDVRGGDYAKLRHWNLLEKVNDDWIITNDGICFVERKAKVNKYCLLYNNIKICLDGPLIDIRQACNEKFDFEKLIIGI